MGILQVQGINLSFGDRQILSDVGFTLSEKCRAALCGGNGEGKSTLLKIVAGWMHSDGGQINKTQGMKVSYLPQNDIVFKENTVYEEIEKAFSTYKEAEQRQKEVTSLLVKNPHDKTLLDELDKIHNTLYNSDVFNYKAKIYSISQGLGFKAQDLARPCCEFSGGYQMRIALCKILAENPDVMLLDEPTNYLDIESRYWLRNYLKTYNGSLLIVCHDRDFLDTVVTEVFELFNGRLSHYSGNYSFYEKQRSLEIEQLEAAYRKQTAEIEKTEDFIEKFRYKATKARQVQSRVKMLEKIERIVLPSHLKKLKFSFPEPPHSPNDMVRIENLTKAYYEDGGFEKSSSIKPMTEPLNTAMRSPREAPQHAKITVFENFNLSVNKGTRLAVSGHNGIGKSTLLRIIAGSDNNYSGTVTLGSGIKIGYYAQDGADTLNRENTVLEEVLPFGTEGEMRNALGSFLFSGDDIYKSVSVLSGGEKSRLLLLKILLRPANLLILDEPTNHLDINAKDMLLNALKDYKGTLIFVSHDTYFIKNIATSILYLSETGPELFNGDWNYFEWRLSQSVNTTKGDSGGNNTRSTPIYEQESTLSRSAYIDRSQNANNAKQSAELSEQDKNQVAKQAAKAQSKEDRAQANKLKNQLNKTKREQEDLLLKIQSVEEEIAEAKELLNRSEYYSDANKANALLEKISALQNTRDELEEQWLLKTEELEGSGLA